MLENNPKVLLQMVEILKRESKCVKHAVACLIVKGNTIIGNGVNGTPAGYKNCCEVFSKDTVHQEPERTKHREWSLINELHAEENALINATQDVHGAVWAITRPPCIHCQKKIAATNPKKVYILNSTGINLIKLGGVFSFGSVHYEVFIGI